MKLYKIPDKLRAELSKPIGILITESQFEIMHSKFSEIITVGDRVTETAINKGRIPELSVVDNRENREKREPVKGIYSRLIKVKNPAGYLTDEVFNAVKEAFGSEKPVRILVDGEEDLVALPCIFIAPLGDALFYGQPNMGIVFVEVNAESKERCLKIFNEIGLEGKIIYEYKRDWTVQG